MFEWLASLPFWFQISFGLIATSAIVYALISLVRILVQVLKSGFDLRSGDSSLVVGSAHKIKSPHSSCKNRSDIVLLLHETDKILYEKYSLKCVEQIRTQMNYAEQKIDQIRSSLQLLYLELLEKKGITKVVGSISYNFYRLVLKEVQIEILKKYRQAFRENHFDEMTEIAFMGYTNDKFDFFRSETIEIMNNLYFYEEDISREELFKELQSHMPRLKEMFVEIFQSARQISLDFKIKLLECDERLQRLVDKYL